MKKAQSETGEAPGKNAVIGDKSRNMGMVSDAKAIETSEKRTKN